MPTLEYAYINVASEQHHAIFHYDLGRQSVKVYSSSTTNDYDPFDYGANSIAILGNRGYGYNLVAISILLI